MQLFLKPESRASSLFVILGTQEQIIYRMRGELLPLGCRCVLSAPDGKTVARLSGVRIPGSFQYSAACESRRVRMRVRPDALHRPVMFKGVPWRFRGNLVTRSFDIVEDLPGDRPARVVMTHGRCWTRAEDCYVLTVARAADAPLAVCVAVALDSSVQTGFFLPVPVG